MVKETPKILLKALRQYAHNTRVGDLFAGFDYDETVKIVESQAKEIEGLKELVKLAVQWFGDEIENGNGNIEYDELELIYKKLLSKPTEPDTTDKGGG